MLKTHPYIIETGELALYKCPNCGHIQAEYLLSPDFYDEYAAGYGINQYVGSHIVLDKQFKKLRRLINEKCATLLEIGCGTGNALKYAETYFDDYVGVEPSLIEYNIACQQHPNNKFYNNYFDDKFSLDQKVNAFCSFQVFEHLEDLYAPLKKAFDCLVDGGVGLINVPNGTQILEQGLYHQINFEHINYYSPYSLALLCKNAGFDIIDIESDSSAIEINIYVRKPPSILSLNACREKQQKKLKLNEFLATVSSYAIYGAGAKTLYYSSLLTNTNKAKYLFDSNPEKENKYIAGISKPVCQYNIQRAMRCDAIVIFASSYAYEIINKLKNDGYLGKIVYFEGSEIKVAD